MMMNPRKVAVIGCGFVGASIAFALMQKGLFSEMVLIDANHAKAEGGGDGFKPRSSLHGVDGHLCRGL